MDTASSLRHFIRETFLRGDTEALTDTTPLLSSGLLDSTDSLELLLYIESEFGITLGDDEAGPRYLDTIERMAAFIEARQGTMAVRPEAQGESEPRAR